KAVIDFAAFREERNKHLSPIVVDFGEDKLEIPPTMPAGVMLDLMAFQSEHGADAAISKIPPAMAISIMNATIGDDRLQEMIRKYNLQLDEIMWLMENLLHNYMDSLETQPGNSLTTLESRSTSSKTGRSSKATSKT